jgi:hypothetical protein
MDRARLPRAQVAIQRNTMMAISFNTWRCKSCDHEFGSDEPQHKVWYQDEVGAVTPHDARGIPQDVRELLRNMRCAPVVKTTVGPRYYCENCFTQRFPGTRG